MTDSKQPLSQIILYTTPDGTVKIDTVFHADTIWLTPKEMADLFDVNVPAISKNLTKIYEDGELNREATVSKMETVQAEGRRKVTPTSLLNILRENSVLYTIRTGRGRREGVYAFRELVNIAEGDEVI
jgi:hypothetical protein